MNSLEYRLISIVIGYLFGMFQTAYIYGRMNHIDIRQYGSGNAGTTNAMRVLGKKAGIITYIVDTFKAILASILIRIIFGNYVGVDADEVIVLIMYSGFGAVLGHNFPFYMGFAGGKGIAASSGVILSTANPFLILPALFTFTLTTKISRYVSLGSILMMIGYFIETVIFGQLGLLNISTTSHKIEVYIITFLLSALAIYKHKANIGRLKNHTERKIGEKKQA